MSVSNAVQINKNPEKKSVFTKIPENSVSTKIKHHNCFNIDNKKKCLLRIKSE